MPRKPRFVLPGVPQHVIQRGHNREACFYAEDDYMRYLETLHQCATHNQVAIHAYVLMTNHIHVLATPAHSNAIAHMMQDTGRKYVRYSNTRYKRTGSRWEGHYKASVIDSEQYLLTCMRYIEMNPARASMVAHPGDYRWTSYHANAGFKPDPRLTCHPVYKRLGKDIEQQQHAYRELFSQSIEQKQLHEIREALNQELVLGRDDFKDKIEQVTKRQTRPGLRGRPRIEESGADYYVL